MFDGPSDVYWPSNELVGFWTHWYSRQADNAERAGMSTQDYADELVWSRELWLERDAMEQAAADERAAEAQAERFARWNSWWAFLERDRMEQAAAAAAERERAAALQALQAQRAAADERAAEARAMQLARQDLTCRFLERLNEGIRREVRRREQQRIGVIGKGPGQSCDYRREVDADGKVTLRRLW